MVCTVDDDYVRDRVRWVATLSNGEAVYQDDDRPGEDEPSAWKRLGAYCLTNDLHIRELWLQFRSNRVLIEPTGADGYFFVKSAFGVWGEDETHHAYVVGAYVDGLIHAQTWKVPELVLIETQTRETDVHSPCLILRRG